MPLRARLPLVRLLHFGLRYHHGLKKNAQNRRQMALRTVPHERLPKKSYLAKALHDAHLRILRWSLPRPQVATGHIFELGKHRESFNQKPASSVFIGQDSQVRPRCAPAERDDNAHWRGDTCERHGRAERQELEHCDNWREANPHGPEEEAKRTVKQLL